MSIDDALKGIGIAAQDAMKALEDFSNAKTDALKAGDYNAVRQITELEKVTRKLAEAKLKEASATETLLKLRAKSGKLTKDEIKLYTEAESVIFDLVDAQDELKNKQVDLATARKKARSALLASSRALKENLKDTTALGKAYSVMGSGLSKVTAGLTVGGLAMKAWNRFTEGAEIRQQIMIQNFRGFADGAKVAGESVGEMAKRYTDAISKNDDMAKALITARSAAIKMGVPVEQMNETMVQFARITGSDNPAALGKLSAAAATVSRTLGISMPEAVDFVQQRMDKFGGTAASAIIGLNNIRTATEDVNKMFGRTMVRGDDVARTLLDISRSTNVYAIDQRMVSSLLRENITRLQAAGDSYELAARKARLFAEATAGGDAPAWMKIIVGGKLTKAMKGAFGKIATDGGKEWEDKFGESLDNASPGLSEKVKDVLGDKNMGSFTKFKVIQDLTKGTTVGARMMAEEFANLANQQNGIAVLAVQMGKTEEEIRGILAVSNNLIKTETEVDRLITMKPGKLQKELKVSKEIAALMTDQNTSLFQRREMMKKVLETQALSEAQTKIETDQIERQEKMKKKKETAGKHIEIYKEEIKHIVEDKTFQETSERIAETQKELAAMASNDPAREGLKEQLKKDMESIKIQKETLMTNRALMRAAEETIAQQAGKGDEDKESASVMEQLTDESIKEFDAYSQLTLKGVRSTIEELSSIKNIVAATLLWHMGGKFANSLVSMLAKGGGKGGGIAGKAGKALKGGVLGLPKVFQGLARFGGTLVAELIKLGASIVRLLNPFNILKMGVKKLGAAGLLVATGFGFLSKIQEAWGDNTEKLMAIFSELGVTFSAVGDLSKALWTSMGVWVDEAWEGAKKGAAGYWEEAKVLFSSVKDEVLKIFTSMYDALPDFMKDGLSATGDAVEKYTPDIIKEAASAAMGVVTDPTKTGENIAQAGSDLMGFMFDGIKDGLSGLTSTMDDATASLGPKAGSRKEAAAMGPAGQRRALEEAIAGMKAGAPRTTKQDNNRSERAAFALEKFSAAGSEGGSRLSQKEFEKIANILEGTEKAGKEKDQKDAAYKKELEKQESSKANMDKKANKDVTDQTKKGQKTAEKSETLLGKVAASLAKMEPKTKAVLDSVVDGVSGAATTAVNTVKGLPKVKGKPFVGPDGKVIPDDQLTDEQKQQKMDSASEEQVESDPDIQGMASVESYDDTEGSVLLRVENFKEVVQASLRGRSKNWPKSSTK